MDGQWDLAFRLYRWVIKIDDGRLLLRPYMSPATIVVRGSSGTFFPIGAMPLAFASPRRRIVGFTDEILKDLYDHSEDACPIARRRPVYHREHRQDPT
jgi:hypothetical protein